MKRILLFVFVISFVSCKTQSNIVTSKKEAKEKGIYDYSVNQDTKIVKVARVKKSNNPIVKTEPQPEEEKPLYRNNNKANSLAFEIVDYALDNLGVKYRTGGTSRKGMDCSGLVFSTFGNYDISLPRTSIDMSRHGEEIKRNDAQPGDLIFFKTNGRTVINHVGIVTQIREDGEIEFIHSSTRRGVIISSTADNYYSKTYAQVNRVLSN